MNKAKTISLLFLSTVARASDYCDQRNLSCLADEREGDGFSFWWLISVIVVVFAAGIAFSLIGRAIESAPKWVQSLAVVLFVLSTVIFCAGIVWVGYSLFEKNDHFIGVLLMIFGGYGAYGMTKAVLGK